MNSELPVKAFLPEIAAAVEEYGKVLVCAAPGAGKTMLIPELFRRLAPQGRTLLIEPRRIAARAAAAGICAVHHLTLGRECGFAVRGEQISSADTGIMVVTPGVYLQMLQQDMALAGIAAVIFDEFHERSLEADLALALTLDVQSALRSDLRLGVMSATLDAEKVGEFLQAPVISVPGRSFPVTISYRPGSTEFRDVPVECARAVMEQCRGGSGDMLVFLPGAGEIEKCALMLDGALPDDFAVYKLHGSLPFSEQKRVLQRNSSGKKRVILATNVAESSLTIDGIECVIDSGWEKSPVYRPAAGMTFLEPARITVDSAVQRAGRAGRNAPGRAIRCWDAFQEKSFAPHAVPEILTAELSGLYLAIASWGTVPQQLCWLDPPPESGLAAAKKVLTDLGMLDASGKLTDLGRSAAALPVQIRQAAMLLQAPENMRFLAVMLAALLEEKDEFRGYCGADLRDRLQRFWEHPEKFPVQSAVRDRLRKLLSCRPDISGDPGRLIAAAFPEWIGMARGRHSREFLLSGGRSAVLNENDPLLGAEFLAIAGCEAVPGGKDARIRLAVPVAREVLEELLADRITVGTAVFFDPETEKFSAYEERKLGALTLHRRNIPVPADSIAPALLAEAFRRKMLLPPPEAQAACRLLARIRFGKSHGMDALPDVSGAGFEEYLQEFALPFLKGINSLAALKKAPWYEMISAMLDYHSRQELDRLCPDSFTAPSGVEFKIDYTGEVPVLAIPVQHLYGVKIHPCAGANRTPLKLELLSPARRPIQITSDLPGFWQGSWSMVVKEMRARYPKHEWADDPANAAPMRHSVRRAREPR